MKQLYSIKAAALYLGISKSTVKAYLAAGVLQKAVLPSPKSAHKKLRRTLISQESLDELIKVSVGHEWLKSIMF